MAEPPNGRPRPLHVSRSFTRMAASEAEQLSRKRASTLQPGITAVPEAIDRPVDELNQSKSDVFENPGEDGSSAQPEHNTEISLPSKYEDLPFEVRSMTDRFLDGLTAKVHPAPLSADQLSQMFQDFYDRASTRIATHIASLAAKLDRPEPTSGRSSIKGRSRAGSGAKRAESPASMNGGEMMTPSEVTDRRRAKRILELKRVALEETVERCVCERLYDKLWKHRSTDDDARDEKLRSKIAALALVGIGLKELHTDSDASSQQAREIAAEKESDINAALEPARSALQQMNAEKYPLGKLQHLTSCHKSIVETLSAYIPSSSSADEILPTLIYTLITASSRELSVVSNLSYIQRFRAADKVDGEAAYCLVNLEAAIAFLENVDLSSLRADELPSGPPRSSQPQTPTAEEPEPMREYSPRPEDSPSDKSSLASPVLSRTAVSAPSRPNVGERSLSAMMQAQASKLEAGRENLLSTADRVYDSLNGTLENSFKFVFGRFKETVAGPTALPKTLDDARRLINPQNEDDDLVSGRSTPSNAEDRIWPSDDKTLDLIAGRKPLRDRSADSTRSGGSAKRVGFLGETSVPGTTSSRLPTPQESLSGAANFITSINPLNRFGVPSFPRFGKQVASPVLPNRPAELPRAVSGTSEATQLEKTVSRGREAGDDLNAREAIAALRRLNPPKKRFLQASSAAELRIGDVDELLLEYKRLAKAIGDTIRS